MTSLMAVLIAIYSASVEDRAICVCNLLAQTNGHPAYIITYPERDLAVSMSVAASSLFQLPGCPVMCHFDK